MKRFKILHGGAAVVMLAVVVSSGCTRVTPEAPDLAAAPTAAVAVVAATAVVTTEPTAAPPPTAALTATAAPTATALADRATETPASPEQALAERFSSFTTAPTAQGEVLLLTGRVLDTRGNPVSGAAVEIWHTDAQGIYDHPGDRSTNNRDRGFQFYGTSITNGDGVYTFRTIKPGQYEPRPRHIHVKVKRDGKEVLTTQFYFEADRDTLAQEGIFAQSGDLGAMLILKAVDILDGVPVLSNDLVIDTGTGSGTLQRTPAQTEGPYYPRAVVADFDNDLALVP